MFDPTERMAAVFVVVAVNVPLIFAVPLVIYKGYKFAVVVVEDNVLPARMLKLPPTRFNCPGLVVTVAVPPPAAGPIVILLAVAFSIVLPGEVKLYVTAIPGTPPSKEILELFTVIVPLAKPEVNDAGGL